MGERKRAATSLSNLFILYKGTRTKKGDKDRETDTKKPFPFFLCNGLLAAFLLTPKECTDLPRTVWRNYEQYILVIVT